jgi:hypothetical protein
MSEARLELVETILCDHGVAGHCGVVTTWPLTAATNANDLEGTTCPGGSRRVLSVPTDQMVEIAAKAIHETTAAASDGPQFWLTEARAALTAAFNTLGIQEPVK